MKKNLFKYLLPVVAVIAFYACTKNTGITNQPYDAYGGLNGTNGQLKINLAFAYTVDYSTILIKLNGNVVSNSLQTRTPFPGGGYNTRGSNFALYLSVPIGDNTVSVILPKVGTTTDSIVLYTTKVTIPDSNPYTLHIADTAANTKSILVKNLIDPVDTAFCRYRFVNLVPNSPIDLYLNGNLVKGNIAFLAATDTFRIPILAAFGTSTTPTWTIRPAGASASSTAIATYASASSWQNQAVMTVYSMGYNGGTGTRAPFVSFTLDKNQ
jgi:hypothetical protein